MQLDTAIQANSWNELEALEKETKALLETIRGKPRGQKGKEAEKKDLKNKEKEKEKSKKKKQIDIALSLSKSLPSAGAQVRQNGANGRVTVEILDDASPDTTPRLDVTDIKEKQKEIKSKAQTIAKSEAHFRQMLFGDEKSRVLANDDTFVPFNKTLTSYDVEKERDRLERIENSLREKKEFYNTEFHSRKTYLKSDRCALKIQSFARGVVGRQKFKMILKLKKMREEEEFGDWIEVQDPESKDTWYYNKKTNVSQWTKPIAMSSAPSPKTGGLSPSKSPSKKGGKLSVSMSLPTFDAMMLAKDPYAESPVKQGSKSASKLASKKVAASVQFERERAQQVKGQMEVNELLGVSKLTNQEMLTIPDGTFRPDLKKTVLDALLNTRFDSVSTVLEDNQWFEEEDEAFMTKSKRNKLAKIEETVEIQSGLRNERVDHSRQPLAAIVTFNKSGKKGAGSLKSSDYNKVSKGREKYEEEIRLESTKDLSFKDLQHPGFEKDPNVMDDEMCFGCWSAGLGKRCRSHAGDKKVKSSQTMLLCRNWDLSVMRRRYRSEDLQEVFMRREKSLRFDVKHKKFTTKVEAKHMIYRGLNAMLELFNSRMALWVKVKRWIISAFHQIRYGNVEPKGSQGREYPRDLRDQMTLENYCRVTNYSTTNRSKIAIPPITGRSWPELLGQIQYLFEHYDNLLSESVDIIHQLPLSVPTHLYIPRSYHLSLPRSIPMPKPEYNDNVKVSPANKYIDDGNPAAWLERLVDSNSKYAINASTMQIQALTPVSVTELVQRTKRPTPNTISFASLGQKPVPDNICLGGLPLEFLVYQLVTTWLPVQYGNFMVMDKAPVSPGVSPELTIFFETLLMSPILQKYLNRPLEHPLNYRHPPTITANSSMTPDQKHFYGLNRPEQTGEQESHGFRTTTWSPMLLCYQETDPQAFIPGHSVVSLNIPKSNASFTTHADQSYPFCEPSTRDNSTLDFYHLLLMGKCSPSKAQVFTALTCQEPGEFLKNYKIDVPMGHLVVAVYRSWAFTQMDTIQEFKTDDGIPYWYHRKTGQTFWERPLHEQEEESPLLGGTILDHSHPDEPSTIHAGSEGAERRYLQGEFREHMIHSIETKKEAINRRTAASLSVRGARERGVLPEPIEGASMMNNPLGGNSLEAVSKFDYSQHNNHSMIATEASGERLKVGFNDSIDMQAVQNGRDPNGSSSAVHIHSSTDFKANGAMTVTGGGGGFPRSPGSAPGTAPGTAGSMAGTIPGSSRPPTHPFGPGLPAPKENPGIPGGLDEQLMLNLSAQLGKMMGNMMSMDQSNPQDMIQLGLGMGMALLGTGAVDGMINAQNEQEEARNGGDGFIASLDGGNAEQGSLFPSVAEDGTIMSHGAQNNSQIIQDFYGEPIGVVNTTVNNSTDKMLDATEALDQKKRVADRIHEPLNSVEMARSLQIELRPSETPDEIPQKVLSKSLPANAEEAAKTVIPVVAYPELSSRPDGGAPATYSHKPPAGLDTSFVSAEKAESQLLVAETKFRKMVMPLPIGFYDCISAKHIAKQAVDYLPQVPNIPQSRTIGRVKPRSSAVDWMMIHFDPWSAGKNPLGTEFVPSLMAKADRLLAGGSVKAQEEMEEMRGRTLKDAFAAVVDEAGLAQQRAEVSKDTLLAQDFKTLCSLCRHSKYQDAEALMNQPDWNVPIDYQDDQGNALLHIVSQNGNKRMVKLCMRRGASLNIQNLTGQTPLHFAYGYGYADVGDYILSKGGDDNVKNKDGLTCYEGLGAGELSML